MANSALLCLTFAVVSAYTAGFSAGAGLRSTETTCPVDTFQHVRDRQAVEMSCGPICPPLMSTDQALTFCATNCRRYFECLLTTLPNPHKIRTSMLPSQGTSADTDGVSCASTVGLFFHPTEGFHSCERVCSSPPTLFCRNNCPGYACHVILSATTRRTVTVEPQTKSGHAKTTAANVNSGGSANVNVSVGVSNTSTAKLPTGAAVDMDLISTDQRLPNHLFIIYAFLITLGSVILILVVIAIAICMRNGGLFRCTTPANKPQPTENTDAAEHQRGPFCQPSDALIDEENKEMPNSNGDVDSSMCTRRDQPGVDRCVQSDDETDAKLLQNSTSTGDGPCNFRSDGSAGKSQHGQPLNV